MAVDSFAVFLHGEEATLSPSEIERELSSMWKPLQETAESHQSSVTRVVLGNLIWVGLTSQMEHTRPIIQRVIPKFPCRLFLLEYDRGSEAREVAARVNAQCFVPETGKEPVCCEVVHLVFGPESARHLRGCVVPLLVPGVQTVLWENLAGVYLEEFNDLQQYADRTITQVSLTRHPARVLERVAANKRPTYDLSWFRMAEIRDQVTAFFDDPAVELDLRRLTRVSVGVVCQQDRPTLPELLASLFVGWLGSALGWKPGKPRPTGYVYMTPEGRPVQVEVHRIGDGKREDPQNHLGTICLEDDGGRRFNVSLGAQDGTMRLWCAADRGAAGSSLVLSELPEAEALGTALNRPATNSAFVAAARLAAPLLEHIHEGNLLA